MGTSYLPVIDRSRTALKISTVACCCYAALNSQLSYTYGLAILLSIFSIVDIAAQWYVSDEVFDDPTLSNVKRGCTVMFPFLRIMSIGVFLPLSDFDEVSPIWWLIATLFFGDLILFTFRFLQESVEDVRARREEAKK